MFLIGEMPITIQAGNSPVIAPKIMLFDDTIAVGSGYRMQNEGRVVAIDKPMIRISPIFFGLGPMGCGGFKASPPASVPGGVGSSGNGGNMKNKSRYEVVELSTEHLLEVLSVQEELAIGKKLIEAGEKIAPRGLLICGYERQDFEEYLKRGAKIFGAYGEGRKLMGYILLTPSEMFFPKFVDARVDWEESIDFDFYQKKIMHNEYVYLDQIGVVWDRQQTGLSDILLQNVERMYGDQSIITLIMTSPIDNVRSRNFFAKNGYQKICDIAFDRYGTIKNFQGILLHKKVKV